MGRGSASEMTCISSRIAIPCHISTCHLIQSGFGSWYDLSRRISYRLSSFDYRNIAIAGTISGIVPFIETQLERELKAMWVLQWTLLERSQTNFSRTQRLQRSRSWYRVCTVEKSHKSRRTGHRNIGDTVYGSYHVQGPPGSHVIHVLFVKGAVYHQNVSVTERVSRGETSVAEKAWRLSRRTSYKL